MKTLLLAILFWLIGILLFLASIKAFVALAWWITITFNIGG